MAEQIYLSRRNLLTLLSKLDRKAAGESTSCTVIKYQNKADPFVQSMDAIAVTAVEDSEFYASRAPGAMHPNDEVAMATKIYGDMMASMPDESPPVDRGITTADLALLPLGHHLYTGYEVGVAAREILGMDGLDQRDVLVVIDIPDDTYSISDSFWRGFLTPSLDRFGDKASALRKLTAGGPQQFQASFDSYVTRHFIMRGVK